MSELAIYAKGITKVFGDVIALKEVDFSVYEGEIHGLLGENGAGKTTLMNILYGLYTPDKGEIFIKGKKVRISSPLDSIKLGIGMVHQVSTLVPEFTGFENIVLGTPKIEGEKAEREKIEKLSSEFGFKFPLDVKTKELPAGIKQKIEIVRALYRGARILILDEPTTSLVEEEFEQLLKSLRLLVSHGVSIIFITHKIKEVMKACDRASVLKGGVLQGTVEISKVKKEDLVALMFVGQKIEVTDSALPVITLKDIPKSDEPVCILKDIHTKKDKKGFPLKGISLEVYKGEILGVAGISGNGQKELAEAIINPTNISSGEIYIKNTKVNKLSTLDVFSLGVFYVPEDRIKDAILPDGSIKENVLLGHHEEPRFIRNGTWVMWDKVAKESRNLIKKYNVKAPHENIAINKLSGGNIQKVVFGRALLNEIDLLVTHNPTSGLDMSSVEFIFNELLKLRENKKAVFYINEDLDELMLLSDRIAVLREGKIVGVFERKEFDKQKIGTLMVGGE